MGLTVEELCNLDRVVTRVDVSRWTGEPGSHVCITEISASEFYGLGEGENADKDRLIRLVAASLCDEGGKKLAGSTSEERERAVESVRQIPIAMMMAIVNEANRLNSAGAVETLDEELEKNSPEET